MSSLMHSVSHHTISKISSTKMVKFMKMLLMLLSDKTLKLLVAFETAFSIALTSSEKSFLASIPRQKVIVESSVTKKMSKQSKNKSVCYVVLKKSSDQDGMF